LILCKASRNPPTSLSLCSIPDYQIFWIDVYVVPRNQKTLVPTTIRALHELCGHSWGKHGDIVFFVMGAYRDENKKIMTFKYVHSESSSKHHDDVVFSLFY
jgi:hypothetical protein